MAYAKSAHARACLDDDIIMIHINMSIVSERNPGAMLILFGLIVPAGGLTRNPDAARIVSTI